MFMKRHGTVITRADTYIIFIEELGDVMRMHAFERAGKYSAAHYRDLWDP